MNPLPAWLEGVQRADEVWTRSNSPPWRTARIYDADTGEQLDAVVEMDFRGGQTVEMAVPIRALRDRVATVVHVRKLEVRHGTEVYRSEDYPLPKGQYVMVVSDPYVDGDTLVREVA